VAEKPKQEEPAREPKPKAKALDPHADPHSLSPGAYAESVLGYSEAEPDSDESRAHSEAFNALKRQRRFGY